MSTLALTPVAPVHLARAVIAHHSKSFALASKLLPVGSRDDAAVLYAWCRRADDEVDLNAIIDPAELLARLADELDVAYDGTAQDPLLAAFGHVARARAIPSVYPRELLAGMAMDLADRRYATVEDVIVYAYRVAGVVGLMMTHVLGIDDEEAIVPAAHLGIAMQLTNICRDVAEDWQRGRLYIPDELLARHGSANLARELGEPLPIAARAALAGAVRDLLALADRYYRSADRGLVALPARAAFAIRSARDIYAAIGDRIAHAEHDVTAGRAIVPKSHKLARVALAAVRTLASTPRRIGRAGRRGSHRPPSRILELCDVPRL
jgi:15-cis-phytoene synthase